MCFHTLGAENLSAFQTIRADCLEQLTCWRLLFERTYLGWKHGLMGTSWGSAKSCPCSKPLKSLPTSCFCDPKTSSCWLTYSRCGSLAQLLFRWKFTSNMEIQPFLFPNYFPYKKKGNSKSTTDTWKGPGQRLFPFLCPNQGQQYLFHSWERFIEAVPKDFQW